MNKLVSIFSSTSFTKDESESDNEEVDNSEDYKEKIEYLSKLKCIDESKYDDYKLQVYKMSGKDLILLNPSLYKEQRLRTDDHVKNISNALYGRKIFHHNIILVNNEKTETIEIFDGQHRIESLKTKGPTIQSKIDCFVHLYTLNTDDEQFLQELYNEINVIKGNTDEEKYDQKYATYLAKELQTKFGRYYSNNMKIVDLEKNNIKYEDRWKLSYHELKQQLEKKKIKKSVEECYQILIEYNKECKRKCVDSNQKYDEVKGDMFFGQHKMNNKSMREKCVKYEFFLGICLEEAVNRLV